MSIRRIIAQALVVGLLFHGGVAWSQTAADKTTARNLARDGQTALMEGNFEVAAENFDRARKLVDAPTLHVRYARARVGQGHLVEAYEVYQQVVRKGVTDGASLAFRQAVAEAEKEAAALPERFAWVTIRVKGLESGDTAIVEVNGEPLPAAAIGVERPADPGTLVITARAEGYDGDQTEVIADEGERDLIAELTLTKQPEPDPVVVAAPVANAPTGIEDRQSSAWRRYQKPAGWTALGIGAAGLVVGVVGTGLAVSEKSGLDPNCIRVDSGPAVCPDEYDGAISRYQTAGNVAVAGYIGAGVFLAAGAALLLTLPASEDHADGEPGSTQAAITPYVTFGGAGVRGRF